jgi:hypothetical protein
VTEIKQIAVQTESVHWIGAVALESILELAAIAACKLFGNRRYMGHFDMIATSVVQHHKARCDRRFGGWEAGERGGRTTTLRRKMKRRKTPLGEMVQ